MQKIPTVFVRDFDGDPRYVLEAVTPGCEWALAGEGRAARKYDGTCVMFDGTAWWARREVKAGKTAPAGFVPLGVDEATGKAMGWEPVEASAFARWHAEARAALEDFCAALSQPVPACTYELIGPKINGNPERIGRHRLLSHAAAERITLTYPATYASLREVMDDLRGQGVEGIVWHHPDGRMAKLKCRDFPRDA